MAPLFAMDGEMVRVDRLTGWRWSLAIVVLSVAYFYSARFGLSHAILIPQVSAVWPPTGLALAALILLGARMWPGVFLGAFLANYLQASSAPSALGIAIGNTLEAVAGAMLLQRLVGFRAAMDRVRDVLGLAAFGAVVSPLLSASAGMFSLWAAGEAPLETIGNGWLIWWVGDAMGALIVAPVILTWGASGTRPPPSSSYVERLVHAAILLAVSYAIFTGPVVQAAQLKYLMFPLLIWSAMRLGQRITSTSVLLVAAMALWGVSGGRGAFIADTLNEYLVLTQGFMGVLAFTALTAGALVSERAATAEKAREQALAHADLESRARQLRELASQLTKAEERERRRFAQLLHDGLQQFLVAARMEAEIIRRMEPDASVRARVEQLSQLLSESIEQSRTLAADLSPPILYNSDFQGGFEWLGRHIRQRYGVHVDVHVDAHTRPADEDVYRFLFHAARELLLNVVNHAGVKSARLTVGRPDPSSVEIVVADEGTGFDVLSRMRASQRQFFGLFSIRERIENLGGKMAVESVPGKGTSVRLIAPAELQAELPVRTLAGHEPRPVPVGHIRALLVDDHQAVREGIAKILSEAKDIQIVGQAGSGEQALAVLQHDPVDVVVMDVSMPGMSGIEATRRISDAFPHVRVIGMSMHREEEVAAAMHDAGAVAYLTKSDAAEDLVFAIRAAVLEQSSPPLPTVAL